jgi:hypothetical protein
VIPFDSFLLDPSCWSAPGFLAARITRGLGPRRRQALWVLGTGTMAVFWVTSVSLYLNREWTRWIWEMCRAESGRDWMLNSGVFRFDHREPSPRTHAASAAILATYPAWLVLGVRLGWRPTP